MKKQDEGFTLVELLIVIVILGILATVVVFAVRGITDEGQQNACDVGERTVATAQEAYYAAYQTYASNTDQLVDAGLIRDDSGEDDWTTDSGGTVTAAAGGNCA